MLTLIIVLMLVVRIVYCKKHRKQFLDNQPFFFLLLLSLCALAVCIGLIISKPYSYNVYDYQQENVELNNQLEEITNNFILEIQEHPKEVTKARLDAFISEYTRLKALTSYNDSIIERGEKYKRNSKIIKFLV